MDPGMIFGPHQQLVIYWIRAKKISVGILFQYHEKKCKMGCNRTSPEGAPLPLVIDSSQPTWIIIPAASKIWNIYHWGRKRKGEKRTGMGGKKRDDSSEWDVTLESVLNSRYIWLTERNTAMFFLVVVFSLHHSVVTNFLLVVFKALVFDLRSLLPRAPYPIIVI